MIEFGKSLRLAREGKGLTAAQVADVTHMAPKTVLDLEAENFSHIAAPIYGRGFVKLYCEAVGLDPKPFIDEFMAIYNGVRDVGIREREPKPLPAAAPKAQPTPIAASAEPPAALAPEPPSPAEAGLPPWPDDYALRPEEPKKQAAATPQPFAAEPPPAAPLSRYAAPVRQERAMPTIPPAVWRIGVLTIVGLLMLWGLLAGVRALYRATSGTATPTEVVTESQPIEKTPAAAPAKTPKTAEKKSNGKQKRTVPETKAPRTPQKIPSLYID